MKAKQARVECIQKTFLHRKSFFPSFCGVGPLVTENQTLWLPKSFSNPVQTCNKSIQGYLVELANSQNQIKLYTFSCLWFPTDSGRPLKLWNLPRRKKYHDLQVVRCSICHSTPSGSARFGKTQTNHMYVCMYVFMYVYKYRYIHNYIWALIYIYIFIIQCG